MDNSQLANAYAIAKTLGFEKSFNDFQNMYSQYYEEAINVLKSQAKPNRASAIVNPFKN